MVGSCAQEQVGPTGFLLHPEAQLEELTDDLVRRRVSDEGGMQFDDDLLHGGWHLPEIHELLGALDVEEEALAATVGEEPELELSSDGELEGVLAQAAAEERWDLALRALAELLRRAPDAIPRHQKRVEIAYRSGWIDAAQLEALAAPMMKNGYGQYLMQVLHERVF